ncbi:MAG: tRNA pseudouridine(38-40) synthase TruA [Verrucomicrobiae bacterium]|nr:tRNA pseudouridine(38-40) synthase TruA [Verrucomicrobiae bacterium]
MSVSGVVKFKLVIAYEGTRYQGWQVQKIGVGVQQKVEEAFARLLPAPVRVHGSSRTDTGVHAVGMVAHVEVPETALRLPEAKWPLALNAHLPEDIRVLSVRRCAPDFHARFQARGKQYRYFVWNHPAHHPLLRHLTWHVPRPLELAPMREAARYFLGRHDFRSFAANRNYEVENTVRTITRLDIRRAGPQWTFIIEGDGFLYKMCRGMVGTLVQVGLGRIPPEAIPAMLKQRDRRVAGMTAPAHGLVLWKVFYGRAPADLPAAGTTAAARES